MATLPEKGAAGPYASDTLVGVDIAQCIAATRSPVRMARRAASSDIVCLALATADLFEICTLAADFLTSRQALLDASARFVDVTTYDALDDRHDAALLDLGKRLAGLGLLTLPIMENTNEHQDEDARGEPHRAAKQG